VDTVRIGRALRAIRIRSGLSQADVALRAGVSRAFVSKVERGLAQGSDLRRIESICRVLGADLDVRIRWRGEGLDRLLDEAHARLVEKVVRRLSSRSWECAVEVSFSEFGERGSIDVLAWHRESRALLVIEVKSVVPDVQATIFGLDRKARLGPKVGMARGWEAASTSRLLVVRETSASRRRVAIVGSVFEVAFPARGSEVRRWLRRPNGALSGLLFLPYSTPGGIGRGSTGRQRVSRSRIAPKPPQ
jgi:transcriptional regulator with XRE-family HTH domain